MIEPLSMTPDTQAPDFAGIAHNAARAWFFVILRQAAPDASELVAEYAAGMESERIEAYASCMEVRLRSDWETIRLLRAVSHPPPCDFDLPFSPPIECTCGLSAHLSKLLEPFTP